MRQLMLAAIALLTGASSSLAQGHMGTPQEQQACTRDAQRLCRKQLGDDNAVQQCLQQNRTKLSKNQIASPVTRTTGRSRTPEMEGADTNYAAANVA